MEIYNGSWKVYIHTNKINGKMYIGITSTSLKKRFGDCGSGYKEHNVKFWRAIQKYGWDNFEHELFADNLTEDEANNMEHILIDCFDTINNGYNCREGGKAGKLSEETKQKIKEKRAQQLISMDSIRKTQEKNKGKVRTEEMKQRARECKIKYMKRVYCEETDIIYPSISDAARKLHMGKSAVSQVCNGHISQCNGYHLCFV